MDKINKELIEDLKKLNNKLNEKILSYNLPSNNELRKNMESFGEFISFRKLNEEEILKFSPMACVDGSYNKYGGTSPNYIYIFQGLSKISVINENIFRVKTYSPILDEDYNEESLGIEDQKIELLMSKKNLVEIELDVAIETCENYDIKFLLMDGNLIRYANESEEKYNKLVEITGEKNIILAGYIKEAKTNSIYNLISGKDDYSIMDKDLLFGVLEYGEGYILKKDFNKKIENNITSLFLRTSDYPGVTSIEMLERDEKYLKDISDLCFNFTLKSSRGVPMIIDIVDKEVKLDNKITDSLILANIDRDIIERFFTSERSLRRI